jgi:hypothetical protein
VDELEDEDDDGVEEEGNEGDDVEDASGGCD